ncbi:hypothetical protein BRADI_5g22737v3 [Brachypodium distachyon]|uniref:Uncharacterized protein n=1 Tax=Brachypodium distachyon TaxID=15368 RepID=A0A2K2CIP7_BRADI|nr:hypothetical protein BRADI_5g22737v3 [Brachypodium distachyon]
MLYTDEPPLPHAWVGCSDAAIIFSVKATKLDDDLEWPCGISSILRNRNLLFNRRPQTTVRRSQRRVMLGHCWIIKHGFAVAVSIGYFTQVQEPRSRLWTLLLAGPILRGEAAELSARCSPRFEGFLDDADLWYEDLHKFLALNCGRSDRGYVWLLDGLESVQFFLCLDHERV